MSEMTSPGDRPTPSWLTSGLRVGFATSLPIPFAVAVVQAFPDLKFGYPLVLLPLLLAGPFAMRGLSWGGGIVAALLAGALSGLIAAASLAVGSQYLGTSVWGLTGASSAPPMPALPRVTLLPTELLTWPQQDVLFFQPLLALVLAVIARLSQHVGGRFRPQAARLLPRSLGARLTLVFGGLTALTFAVGLTGFGALEEMHYRGHRLQLQADFQRHLSEAHNALAAEDLARRQGVDASRYAAEVDGIYAHLTEASAHPGISLSAAQVRAAMAPYRPAVEAAARAHAAYRAQPDDVAALEASLTTLGTLHRQLDVDTGGLLALDDLAHHGRLIAVMFAVALAGAIGLWFGQRTVAAIDSPLRRLSAHLACVARGEFRRTEPEGPDELRRLIESVNRMTADLERLYATERAGRAAAEALAQKEHELAEAKEFWTNTVVHDLKGPLSIVVGCSELLQEGHYGPLGERQREAVSSMSRAADELLGLVEDINDSFRLEAGALPLERRPVAPAELFRAAAERVGPDGQRPVVQSAAGLPPVLADSRLIYRVLLNLLGNAYKHAGTGAMVTLSAGLKDGQIGFVVEDNGPGIAPEDRARLRAVCPGRRRTIRLRPRTRLLQARRRAAWRAHLDRAEPDRRHTRLLCPAGRGPAARARHPPDRPDRCSGSAQRHTAGQPARSRLTSPADPGPPLLPRHYNGAHHRLGRVL